MKSKHNKKRNTAFLFEALIKELTKSIVEKKGNRSDAIKSILKEHFSVGTTLAKELDCYKTLSEKSGLDKYTAEKMVHRAKHTYSSLDPQEIFKEQSSVIKKINTQIGKEVYRNFVPNYKSYATLAQIFGDKIPLKSQVLLEGTVVENLISEPDSKEKLVDVDHLVVDSFVKNYNKTYSFLLPEQQQLLNKYITSYGDNQVDFKIFLGSELKRVHENITESLELPEVKEDPEMFKNTKRVLERISKMNVSKISTGDIVHVLKLQKLVNEYNASED